MAATPAYAWAAGMFLPAAALAQDTKTDADTGLMIDEGFALVKGQCTGCHSAKLIAHSGKTREGWIDSIRWMQRNQGLGALGSTEEPIVSHPVKHYPVPKTAPWRRPPLPAPDAQVRVCLAKPCACDKGDLPTELDQRVGR